MAQTQNYEVYYDIKVNATEGTEQVTAFANAVEKLSKGRVSFAPVVTNINEMMQAVEKTFRGKNGKKKNFNFDLEIRTGETEKRLEGVKNLLTEIKELTLGIKLTINPGEKIDGRALRNQTNKLVGKKKLDEQQAEAKRNAASAVKSVMDTQRTVTRSIGKINSALAHLEKGREVNIKTDTACVRLQEILSLLGNIRGATTMTLHLGTAVPATSVPVGPVVRPPYAPVAAAVLSDKEQAGLNKRLYADEAMNRQRMQQAKEKAALQVETFRQMSEIRAAERAARLRESERTRTDRELRKIAERTRREELNAEKRRRQAEDTQRRRNAARAVTTMRRQAAFEDSVYGSKRRAAINRIQYSKAPSWRNLPMAGMLNAYMAYNFLRTQFTEAVEYSNIMQSAHSILRVADSDLATFEGRFDRMARYVRRIGVETKFTAIEVAGAVKFLSMAGMGIETINESIRPITNLALIGDNDISQIADLATNIQTGYNIKNTSMGSVADILASTVSRSNVNIIEMAESFKMAAGYLRLSGVDFTEASAAIGVLGNMGIKGTMAGTALRAMATRFAQTHQRGAGGIGPSGCEIHPHGRHLRQAGGKAAPAGRHLRGPEQERGDDGRHADHLRQNRRQRRHDVCQQLRAASDACFPEPGVAGHLLRTGASQAGHDQRLVVPDDLPAYGILHARVRTHRAGHPEHVERLPCQIQFPRVRPRSRLHWAGRHEPALRAG